MMIGPKSVAEYLCGIVRKAEAVGLDHEAAVACGHAERSIYEPYMILRSAESVRIFDDTLDAFKRSMRGQTRKSLDKARRIEDFLDEL